MWIEGPEWMLRQQFLNCLAIVAWMIGASSSFYSHAEEVRFDRQIRPILSANCFNCHGPDAQSREANLRLDTRDGMFADLGLYQIVVPHKPEESELYLRIAESDPDLRMPPADSEHQLTVDEIALIKTWIEQGADWSDHWAFVTPERPAIPDIKEFNGARNPIDHFIRAQLESQGLHPSEPADRRTLLRRVTFDLTGLPATAAEAEAFESDNSPDAYEKVVDRLFASPHYGEHMARYWLDVARYADTHGLHYDNYREIWPYRDWVIRAFNVNLTYDQFLREQLAGDLLPDATLEQQIATGFNRCHVTTNEGGSITEEVVMRNVVDRVSTFGTAMLGMTLGCASCHDHKFDPISQKEFYQLYAFFNSLDGPELDGNTKRPAPVVAVPSEEQFQQLTGLHTEMAELDRQRAERISKCALEPREWLESWQEHGKQASSKESIHVSTGLAGHFPMHLGDSETLENLADPSQPASLVGTPRPVEGILGRAIEITDGSFVELKGIGDFKLKDSFSLGTWLRVPSDSTGVVLAKVDVQNLERGYQLRVERGHIVVQLANRWPGYAIQVKTKQAVLTGDTWHHVAATYDGSKFAQGVTIYVDGQSQEAEIKSDSLHNEGKIETSKSLLVGRCDNEPSYSGAMFGEVRVYTRCLVDSEVRAVYRESQILPLLTETPAALDRRQMELLSELVTIRTDPIYRELTEAREELRQQYEDLLLNVPTTPVFQETSEPIEAHVLIRGQYDDLGETVARDTPVALLPMGASVPRNRLGLAEWLLMDEHPLTSRVAVNRIWQQFFGRGIVETTEDFGVQGAVPSHPELLDWLAVDFRESGWDVKALVKQIVTSATYQQSSHHKPELLRIDTENRLLARGPRFRLDAEMLRDQALAVSGLLHKEIGGPSVKPPQPDGLWRAVGLKSSDTLEFVADEGPEKIYRRSMYTFWKRTSPPPQMNVLDAPNRESCVVRRERTNTPLQSLMLMNEPQFVEAARHFAARLLKDTTLDDEQRVEWAFKQLTLRSPSDEEVQELRGALRDFHDEFSADPAAASQLVAVGETPADGSLNEVDLAAWAMVANLLLNLDEVLTKE